MGLRFRLFSEVGKPANEALRSNLHHLYWDIFWFGVLAGSSMAFLAIYAARLGATTLQIGLLTAGPAIVNLLLTLPAGRWMENHAIKPVVINSAVLHRAGYIVLTLLPMILITQIQLRSIILVTVIMLIPGTFLAISFNAMYAGVVPPDWLGYAVGRRNALVAVSVTLTSLLCGKILDAIIFPLNYQIVFGIGAVGAFLSTYHVARIQYVPFINQGMQDGLVDLVQLGSTQVRKSSRKFLDIRLCARRSKIKLFRLEIL